jgi:hypothetical protein
MEALAADAGIERRVSLHTADATHARVTAEIMHAATILNADDYFLLTFAGHGASYDEIPLAGSRNGIDEADGRDEAWCLYDAYLLDDELHDYLCRFAPGVRICVISDSCFSGTVTRGAKAPAPQSQSLALALALALASDARPQPRPSSGERRAPPALANALYRRDFVHSYQARRQAAVASHGQQPKAHVVLMAACQEEETATETAAHGIFTDGLLTTWRGGQFVGSHVEFIDEIARLLSGRQRPNLLCTGAPGTAFMLACPFRP